MNTRVLVLTGGGSKAFFTLGVLKEIESLKNRPLCESFDLIYATSSGALIGALIALGSRIDEIHKIYETDVTKIMTRKRKKARSLALNKACRQIIGNRTILDLKTNLSVVTTCWDTQNPIIFKSNLGHAHGRAASFIPFFGVPLPDVLEATCSAHPLFDRKIVKISKGGTMELYDGGYCANNPILFAIGDALGPMKVSPSMLRIINIGVGVYPAPKSVLRSILKNTVYIKYSKVDREFTRTTQVMEKLFKAHYSHIKRIYINPIFHEEEMATDLLESNLKKLNLLYRCGRDAFAPEEERMKEFLLEPVGNYDNL